MHWPYATLERILDRRSGLVQYGETPLLDLLRHLGHALPTSAHALRLIDALLGRLGSDGRLDPYANEGRRMVIRRDAGGWWVRQPVALWCENAEFNECDVADDTPVFPTPADAPEGWQPGTPHRQPEPVPDIVPAGLVRGTLTFFVGSACVEIRYDDQGLFALDRALARFGDSWARRRFIALWPPTVDPSARPPQSMPLLWLVDLPDYLTVEALADRILATPLDADPLRIHMPVDAPGGVEGCWWRVQMALRELAFAEALPGDGGILVADAFEHPADATCLAIGPNRDAAFANWRDRHPTIRPRPIRPPRMELLDLPEPEPDVDVSEADENQADDADGPKKVKVQKVFSARLTIQPLRAIPWPIPGLATTPAVALSFPALPDVPRAWAGCGFSRARYLIGESGTVGWAVVRPEPDGFTQVGHGLLDVLDPAQLEAAIDFAIANHDDFPWSEPPWLTYPYEHRWFTAWSNRAQGPKTLEHGQASWNAAWNARDMDADQACWQVLRARLRV